MPLSDEEIDALERLWFDNRDNAYYPSDPQILSLINEVRAWRILKRDGENAHWILLKKGDIDETTTNLVV